MFSLGAVLMIYKKLNSNIIFAQIRWSQRVGHHLVTGQQQPIPYNALFYYKCTIHYRSSKAETGTV